MNELEDEIFYKSSELKKENSEIVKSKISECINREIVQYIDTKRILRLSVRSFGNSIVAILKDFKTDENFGFKHIKH